MPDTLVMYFRVCRERRVTEVEVNINRKMGNVESGLGGMEKVSNVHKLYQDIR